MILSNSDQNAGIGFAIPINTAKAVLDDSAAQLMHFESMSEMGDHYMTGMFPYYRTKLPIIYNLELRDWKTAAALPAAVVVL